MKSYNWQATSKPKSTLVALAGLVVSGCLVVIGFAPRLVLPPDQVTVAHVSLQSWILAVAVAVAIGDVPVLLSIWALLRGKKWAPVATTIAAFWVLAPSFSDSLISWITIAAAAAAAVAAWLPSARQYGISLRAEEANRMD